MGSLRLVLYFLLLRPWGLVVSSVCPWCGYLWSSVSTAWRCSNGSWVSKVHLVLSQLPFLQQMVTALPKLKRCLFPFKDFGLEFKLLIIRYQGSIFMYLFSGPITFKSLWSLHRTDLEEWAGVFPALAVLPRSFIPKATKRAVLFLTFSGSFSKTKLLINYVETASFPPGIEEYVENENMYNGTT